MAVQSDRQILLGGEWESYTMDLKGDKMKLSGEELDEPVTLRRVGPPSARPDSVKIPADHLNSDLHGSAEYRAHLVSVMAGRAVAAAG